MTARATHPSGVCLTCDVPLAPDALFCGACGAPAPALPPAHAVAAPSAPSMPAPSLPAPVATRRSVAAVSGGAPPVPGAGPRSTQPGTVTVAPGEVAPVGARLGALVIDQLLVGAVGAVVLAATDLLTPSTTAALAPLVACAAMACVVAAQWVAEARTGLTVGNLLLGTRTVASATGRPAGLGRVLVRNVVQGLGSVVPIVGTYVVAGSGAWDASPAQRGWHDKAAGTMVLRRDASGREQPVLTVPTPRAERYAAPAPPPSSAPGPGPAPVPVPAPWPAPPSRPSRKPVATQIWLEFDTGESLAVVGDGAVGRHPHGAVDGAIAHAVAIDDPSRSISKLHLVFGPEPGGLWVMDRGSTNGTVVVTPDGVMRALPAGVRAHVAPGWVVRFGERTFRVEAR